MTLADNLIERSADTLSFRHNQTFEAFHLRYLTFDMRQLLWKGALFDPKEYKDYKTNIDGPHSVMYRASRNETFILHEISRIFGELHWTGDLNRVVAQKSEHIILLKEVFIYCQ